MGENFQFLLGFYCRILGGPGLTVWRRSFNSFQDSTWEYEEEAEEHRSTFQFLLGFYWRSWRELRGVGVNFQFLLGFYTVRESFTLLRISATFNSFQDSTDPLSPGGGGGAKWLSIPFRILPTAPPGSLAPGEPAFQFLLGFYATRACARVGGLLQLSIPFRILLKVYI